MEHTVYFAGRSTMGRRDSGRCPPSRAMVMQNSAMHALLKPGKSRPFRDDEFLALALAYRELPRSGSEFPSHQIPVRGNRVAITSLPHDLDLEDAPLVWMLYQDHVVDLVPLPGRGQ